MENMEKTKFCKHCGAKIPFDAIVCTACGCQVEELKSSQQESPQIVINNANSNVNANTNTNTNAGAGHRMCNKWVALCLCIFLGVFGGHKFYEGKAGMGVLYLCTGGLCGIGVICDAISIFMKPNPYAV